MKNWILLLSVFPFVAIAAHGSSAGRATLEDTVRKNADTPPKAAAGTGAGAGEAASDAKDSALADQFASYQDIDYAWDAFKHQGKTVWTCRGVQTGQFVSESLCAFQPKTDAHWPDKSVPANWDGGTRR